MRATATRQQGVDNTCSVSHVDVILCYPENTSDLFFFSSSTHLLGRIVDGMGGWKSASSAKAKTSAKRKEAKAAEAAARAAAGLPPLRGSR